MKTRRVRALAAVLAAALPVLITGSPGAHGSLAVLQNFQQVGHDPLMLRGMNAALAVHGNYAYVGSRTDGKPANLNLNQAGLLVVDISNPAAPQVVKQIGPPLEGNEGETSREMRVWHSQELLIVQNLGSNCSPLIHACSPRAVSDNFRFYDIAGANAADPKLVAEFDPPQNPHEFFLWEDPFIPGRALMFISATSADRLVVVDISNARNNQFTTLAQWAIPAVPGNLHSMGVSNDGLRVYLASLTGGFLVGDSSDAVNGVPSPQFRLVTPAGNRVSWPGPGAHSAVKIWGQDYALITDEVYGDLLQPPVASPPHGCPWGWVRMVNIADPTRPVVAAEYKLPQNEAAFCDTDPPRPSTSISAHNPTLTPDVAFITWHSGGLQAVSLQNPATPTQVGQFSPDPLPAVLQEDPALSAGQDKVVMWSYPVIKDGIIWVTDVRNGLYALRYTGPQADRVAGIEFLEGNSNQGDALLFEPPDPCARNPVPPGFEEQCAPPPGG